MPIDPSIPLAVKAPQIDSPMDTLGKVLAMKTAQQQQQIQGQVIEENKLKLAGQHREAASVEATAAAIKASMEADPVTGLKHPNYEKAASILGQQGFAESAQGLLDVATKTAAGRAQLKETLAKLQTLGQDHLGEIALSAQRALAGGAAPMQIRDSVLNHVAVAAGDGAITEADARQFLQQTAQAPPDALHQVFDQFISPNIRKREAELQKTTAETAKINAEASGTLPLTPAQKAANDARVADLIERQRHHRAMEARPVAGLAGDDSEAIADAIIAGDQPPTLQGLYRNGAAVRASLAKKGFNLAQATTDWQATQKHVATLNGAQQTRMAQAVDNATHSLDVIEDLASQWQGGKFPVLNRAQLALAKQGTLGPKAQQIATQLEAQISDVTSELGNVYMGGNSPTDHALGLAGKNLSADWTQAQLVSAINLARKNLQIRSNSMKNVGVAGASAGNRYAPAAAPLATGADPLGILK